MRNAHSLTELLLPVLVSVAFALTPSIASAQLKSHVLEIDSGAGPSKVYAQISIGKPEKATFVLVNGLIYNLERWDQLTKELIKEGHTVVRYAFSAQPESLRLLLDHEEPSFFKKGLELNSLALELEGVLSQLGVDQRITLVGLSYGASVAAEFASQNPERVEDLILMSPLVIPLEHYDPSGKYLRAWLYSVRFWENAACDFYSAINPWLCTSRDFWYDTFYRTFYEPYLSSRVKTTPQGVRPEVHKKAVFHLVRAVRDFDLRRHAPRLYNTHILVGGKDEPSLRSDQEEVWRELADSQRRSFVVFKGVHHALPDEAPERTAEVLSWIAGKDARVRGGSRIEILADR